MCQNYYAIVFVLYSKVILESIAFEENKIELVDLTRPITNWSDLAGYYNAIEKRWKICVNCGVPRLGTAMHLEHLPSTGSMRPALIPAEYLLTRVAVIDLSTHTLGKPNFILSLEMALQWQVLKHDPREPTLLVFKFGSKGERKFKNCVCDSPGISYELAEWIASNLVHVMGIATDAPTLESKETREFTSRTVVNLLGRNGVYMIANIHFPKNIPEHGCMSIAMPLKLLNHNYVPTRLVAFCPSTKTDKDVVIALRSHRQRAEHVTVKNRVYDINMEDLMQFEKK